MDDRICFIIRLFQVPTYKTPLFRASRVLAGAMNGIVGNAKTMISEVCGKAHEVVGMSFVTGDVTAESYM